MINRPALSRSALDGNQLKRQLQPFAVNINASQTQPGSIKRSAIACKTDTEEGRHRSGLSRDSLERVRAGRGFERHWKLSLYSRRRILRRASGVRTIFPPSPLSSVRLPRHTIVSNEEWTAVGGVLAERVPREGLRESIVVGADRSERRGGNVTTAFNSRARTRRRALRDDLTKLILIFECRNVPDGISQNWAPSATREPNRASNSTPRSGAVKAYVSVVSWENDGVVIRLKTRMREHTHVHSHSHTHTHTHTPTMGKIKRALLAHRFSRQSNIRTSEQNHCNLHSPFLTRSVSYFISRR